MTRNIGIALLAVVAAVGGGAAAVRYFGHEPDGIGGTCCVAPPADKADPNADRPLVELEGDDKKLADAQGFCPVMDDTKLGEMGPPVKLVVRDGAGVEQTVFVCCKGCKRKALAEPAATLAKVAEFKAARP